MVNQPFFEEYFFETNNIFQDQSEYLDSIKSNNDDEIDYSLLLDGLIDEKSQGITIDLHLNI